MTTTGDLSDSDVRRVLESDTGEPPLALDRQICLAARDVLSAEPAAGYGRPGTLRPLVGFAVAATVVLAVLVYMPSPAPVYHPIIEPAPNHVEGATASPSSTPGPVVRRVIGFEAIRERLRIDAARAEFPGAACIEPGIPVLAGDTAICVYPHYLEFFSTLDVGCPEPRRLYHDYPRVTVTTSDNQVDIRVNGEVLWRVSCLGATWRVDAR